jgi:hypothetical protein
VVLLGRAQPTDSPSQNPTSIGDPNRGRTERSCRQLMSHNYAAFQAACRHGRILSQADAIALATAAAQPDPGAPPLSPCPPVRGRRRLSRLAVGQRAGDRSAAGRRAADAQTAGRLFLSVSTVRSHLERIRDKTGARGRADLVRCAIQAGVAPAAPPA